MLTTKKTPKGWLISFDSDTHGCLTDAQWLYSREQLTELKIDYDWNPIHDDLMGFGQSTQEWLVANYVPHKIIREGRLVK